MFRTISNFVRVADIRQKIIFTLLMLVVFRLVRLFPYHLLIEVQLTL